MISTLDLKIDFSVFLKDPTISRSLKSISNKDLIDSNDQDFNLSTLVIARGKSFDTISKRLFETNRVRTVMIKYLDLDLERFRSLLRIALTALGFIDSLELSVRNDDHARLSADGFDYSNNPPPAKIVITFLFSTLIPDKHIRVGESISFSSFKTFKKFFHLKCPLEDP